MAEKDDIIVISDHIEIHPTGLKPWHAVVRDGQVYGTYEDLQLARSVAEELAEKEAQE